MSSTCFTSQPARARAAGPGAGRGGARLQDVIQGRPVRHAGLLAWRTAGAAESLAPTLQTVQVLQRSTERRLPGRVRGQRTSRHDETLYASGVIVFGAGRGAASHSSSGPRTRRPVAGLAAAPGMRRRRAARKLTRCRELGLRLSRAGVLFGLSKRACRRSWSAIRTSAISRRLRWAGACHWPRTRSTCWSAGPLTERAKEGRTPRRSEPVPRGAKGRRAARPSSAGC